MDLNVTKVEETAVKTVADVKGFWPVVKSKIAAWRAVLDAAMVKFGKVKTTVAILGGWLVYFLVGRFVIGVSTRVVAAITAAVLSTIPVIVLVGPYLVLAVLILLTAAFVVDVLLKKKA